MEVIEAPDGSTAAYDSTKTAEAYRSIDAVADCSCAGCRNYRAAWKPEYLDSSLLAACAAMGIDPSKALEISANGVVDNRLVYLAQLPFFGVVTHENRASGTYVPWWFNAEAYGSARIAEGVASVSFWVDMPWVLSEPNPWLDDNPSPG